MFADIEHRLERFAVALASAVTGHPWRTVLAAVVVMAIAASGARFLEFSTNYRVFFGSDNPELRIFEDFQATYTKNDNFLFVLQPAEGGVFEPKTAAAMEELTERAWQIPYTIRVDSVTNFQHSWADGDDLTVEDLVRNGGEMSAAELATREQIALREPLLHSNLITPNADTAAVNVTLQYPEQSLTEVPEAVAVARELAAELEAAYPELTVAISGVSMLNNAFAEAGQQDIGTLIPVMYLVLILFMVIVLRGLAGTVATLLVIVFSTATALGIGGYIGWKLDPVSATAPVIIMTLAIADGVHILVSMLTLMREGTSKNQALVEALRINFLPVGITSITTVIGFLTLNFSDSPPFQHLGTLTAIGIAAAWVFSLTLLPAVVSLLPVRVKARAGNTKGLVSWLGAFADFVTTHYRLALLAAGTGAVALMAFAPTVDLNDEFVKYFDHRVEFRRDTEFVIDNLHGIYLIEYSLEAAESGGISEPEYLTHLAAFTDWLRTQPEVEHVYSYTDIAKRLNKNMHRDDPSWYRLPDDRELAAQYLLLYELSLPFGLDLNDRINVDKSATRVTVTLEDSSTVASRKFFDRSSEWLEANTPSYMWTRPTGTQVMFSYISQRNIQSMLKGNAVAIVMIAAIMILALRSTSLGLLSLIPNTVPILMTFGTWALLVGQVGMAAATVTATSLGIVVDDTVHFLSKYVRARREKGYEPPQAIRYAFETVGLAIISTTLILSAGFAVLAASTFRINAEMGLLTALTIVIALVIDFVLLPALLMIGYTKHTTEETSYEQAATQTI